MAFRRKRKLSKKEAKALKKQEAGNLFTPRKEIADIRPKEKKTVEIPQVITVREYAQILNLPVTKVITELLKNGITATINESIDFETASIVADELGFEVKSKSAKATEETSTKKLNQQDKKNLRPRPPVVVILGHVDHGKTTLLDQIRQTDVALKEAGGITQHIGAYQVKVKNKAVTFLDTPGHEAFSAMRAHGANITDIAILVVAADDGVKPQTKEAISHAKSAGVPIIGAINKIDKPEADVEKVKRELADLDLAPESWGGKTVMVPISAKTGKGIDELLDMILVTAELEELKADPNRPATGVVIESHMQLGMGPLATVLVQNGTLKVKDIVVAGSTYGKIKRLENYKGQEVKEIAPSTPARIAGLKNVPNFGDIVEVVDSEFIAQEKAQKKKVRELVIGLGELSEKIRAGQVKELNIILKADTQGSLGAIKTALSGLSNEEVAVKIIHDNVGNINDSDVNLAVSTKSLVIGFKAQATPAAKNLAQAHNIKISTYDIIYNLIDDLTAAIAGMLKPVISETITGTLEVLKVFRTTKNQVILGGKVIDGKIQKKSQTHILHSHEIIGEGRISSLEKDKMPVDEVLKGFLCGLAIETGATIKPKDLIEAYIKEEKIKKVNK